VVLALVPPLATALHQTYYLAFLSRVMVFGLAAVSLNLILGFGGMTSLGHAAFLGVGAYTVGLCVQNGVTNGYLHFAAAIAFGALAALVIGAVCLRGAGLSFIMLTLASAQLLYFVATGMKQYGGDDGFSFRGHSDFGSWLPLGDDATLYWFILCWLALATLIVHRTVHSRFGLALRGIRGNEVRSATIGLHAYRYKLAAFVLSGALCSVAGALLANLAQFVSPSYMHWGRSAELLLMALLGGMASVLGPLAGAAVFMILEEGLGAVTTHWPALMGLFLVVVVLCARNGLAGLLARPWHSPRSAP
jgi:branched-chain amino acid transport system permease protein